MHRAMNSGVLLNRALTISAERVLAVTFVRSVGHPSGHDIS
jgi:hypothetical protein